METQYVLETHGDALGAVRAFLQRLWGQAGLRGLLAPRRSPGGARVQSEWIESPAALAEVDPFAPLMECNAATAAAARAAESEGPLAALLRPCEARALLELARRGRARLQPLLLIGVDCLATLRSDDFTRRAAALGGGGRLTEETLRFARQGGILLYRDRLACQICRAPLPENVDLSLGVLGLAPAQAVLVGARDARVAERLGLADLTDGPAPETLRQDHARMVEATLARRARARRRLTAALGDVPQSVRALVEHLHACAPCRACLEACALYDGELDAADTADEVALERVARWVSSCAGCGMCQQACPHEFPLAAVIGRLRESLVDRALPSHA